MIVLFSEDRDFIWNIS